MADVLASLAMRIKKSNSGQTQSPESPAPSMPRSVPSTTASSPHLSAVQEDGMKLAGEAPRSPQTQTSTPAVSLTTYPPPREPQKQEPAMTTAIRKGPLLRGSAAQLVEARLFNDSATRGRKSGLAGTRSCSRATDQPLAAVRPRDSIVDRTSYICDGDLQSHALSRTPDLDSSCLGPSHMLSFNAPPSSSAGNSTQECLPPSISASSRSLDKDLISSREDKSPFVSATMSHSASSINKDGPETADPPTIHNTPPHLRTKKLSPKSSDSVAGAFVEAKSSKSEMNSVNKIEQEVKEAPSVRDPGFRRTLFVTPGGFDESDTPAIDCVEHASVLKGENEPKPSTTILPTYIGEAAELKDVKTKLYARMAGLESELFAASSLITKLRDRISQVEKANFELVDKIEKLAERDERRRFLGTNSRNAPYEITMKFPCGTSRRVQVTAMLKISDLIRRGRIEHNISPQDSPAPRILACGEEIGHEMMLGEVGIIGSSFVEFTYDGADEIDEVL